MSIPGQHPRTTAYHNLVATIRTFTISFPYPRNAKGYVPGVSTIPEFRKYMLNTFDSYRDSANYILTMDGVDYKCLLSHTNVIQSMIQQLDCTITLKEGINLTVDDWQYVFDPDDLTG